MFKITTPLLLVLLYSCSKPKKDELPKLTDEQKSKIEIFSHHLVTSINGFDFSVINGAWSNNGFKARVSGIINKIQKRVFEHVFEKDLKQTIKVGNLDIVHRVNEDHGMVSFLRLDHFDHHSELILLLTFDGVFDFFKYRIEYQQNKPCLTDFYHYADNLWYSEKVINMLRLNSKYDAFSDERHLANRAFANSRRYLSSGDTLNALYALYEIPETHQGGNWLSLEKIKLASFLGDSVLATVMVAEYQNNQNLYIKYLYNYYLADTANLHFTYQLLTSELGESEVLDSLVRYGSLWNLKE